MRLAYTKEMKTRKKETVNRLTDLLAVPRDRVSLKRQKEAAEELEADSGMLETSVISADLLWMDDYDGVSFVLNEEDLTPIFGDLEAGSVVRIIGDANRAGLQLFPADMNGLVSDNDQAAVEYLTGSESPIDSVIGSIDRSHSQTEAEDGPCVGEEEEAPASDNSIRQEIEGQPRHRQQKQWHDG
jgi:hypothetical protein